MTPDLDRTLAALADPTRRAVIDLLGKEPLRPSEIADTLDVTRPALSRHLRVLRQAGLVSEQTQRDDARVRVYQLQREPLGRLRDWLDEVEAFWTDQLAAFKEHAESRKSRRP